MRSEENESAIFLYFYKEKWPKMCLQMALKWPKTLQMSWNLDQTSVSMSFIEFQNSFGKFWKLAYFRPKNSHLSRVFRCFFKEDGILITRNWGFQHNDSTKRDTYWILNLINLIKGFFYNFFIELSEKFEFIWQISEDKCAIAL